MAEQQQQEPAANDAAPVQATPVEPASVEAAPVEQPGAPVDEEQDDDIGDVERLARSFPDERPVSAAEVRKWLAEVCIALADRDFRIARLDAIERRA